MKLREEITKNQHSSQTKVSSTESNKAKYSDLIQAVLDLQLVTDPLSEMNLSLHQSFVDDVDQATTHLDEQSRLVKTKLEAHEEEMKALLQKYEAVVQERDAAVASC